MVILCRVILILILAFSVAQFIVDGGQFTISTDLKDLSPALSNAPDTQTAINKLSSHIEGQFSLIFLASSQDAVTRAASDARSALAAYDDVELTADSAVPQLVNKLKQHRFHLLSAEQKQLLLTGNTADIVDKARRNLYQLTSSLQVLPITEDPLGIFADYLSSLFSQLPNHDNTARTAYDSSKTTWFQAVPVTIRRGGLDIDSIRNLTVALKSIKHKITASYPVQILSSGVLFFAADAAEKAQQDIKLISIGSGLGVVLLLLLVFFSAYALLVPVISICVGIIFGISMSHVFYGSVHVLTIVFGASLIGVIIDYSLHYFYHSSALYHRNAPQTVHRLRNSLYAAMTISLLTSLIGYGALSFSELDALKKIAIFSCFGVFAAWICVISAGSLAKAVPVTLSNNLLSATISTFNKGIDRTVSYVSYPLWWVILISCACYLYFGKLPVDDSPRLFFNPSPELMAQEKQASELVSGFEPGQYLIISGNSTESIYRLYENFMKVLDGKIQADGLFSVMSLLPSPRAQTSHYQLQHPLYTIPGASSAFFSAIGAEDTAAQRLQVDYMASKNRLLTPALIFSENQQLPPLWNTINGTIYSFIMISKGSATPALKEASQKFAGISYINTLEMTQHALEAQRLSASVLLVLAYLLVTLLLIIVYRTFAITSLLLVPLSATIGTLLLFTWLGVDITLFHLMGFFLVLGLGMDYSIFSKEMAADMAVSQNAILLSAMTTALSFGLLSISSIPVAKAFGLTLLVGNTLNFIASLLYAGLLRKQISRTSPLSS